MERKKNPNNQDNIEGRQVGLVTLHDVKTYYEVAEMWNEASGKFSRADQTE